ncbi:MAG: polyprenyl diphosphate synthase [Acidobacteriota bacterium]
MAPEKATLQAEPHPLLRLVDRQKVPAHVAIIMDGNGRWATARGLPRIKGHEAGIEAVKEAVKAASSLGVSCLTLYAFSMENWKRPQGEVQALFRLLQRFLTEQKDELAKNRIRLRTIGRIEDLPPRNQKLLRDLAEQTRDGKWTLTLALSYGGRTEIADACTAVCEERLRSGEKGPVRPEEVARHLYAPDLPDPDLLIRTSGEYRVSNFLLWQIAYTEMVILDVLWPDFKEQHFYEAVLDYQRRERRYGGVAGGGNGGARREGPR